MSTTANSAFNGWILVHDDVIKWKIFRVTGPLCWEFHRSAVNSPHKGQWRGALMFSLTYTWINGWVYNREARGLRRHCAHYDVTLMERRVCHICNIWYPKLILNPNLAKSCSSVISIVQSFWNFALSTTVPLPCSVQNFIMIG